MLVIIDANLSAPPSSISCFRDITLFSAIFLKSEILIECEPEFKDTYWHWLKNNYAWDYVEDIVAPFSEKGISIRSEKGYITIQRIDYDSYQYIINQLSKLQNK